MEHITYILYICDLIYRMLNLRKNPTYLICIGVLLLLCLTNLTSCDRKGGEALDANVLLYWPTDENDPSYREWTEIAKEELLRQGIRGEVTVHFAHTTERYESRERPMLNDLILSLRSEGRIPDLILSYGDANRWLLVTSANSVTSSIPVVCFGLHSDEFLPYQMELLDKRYSGGRWNDMVNIRDRMRLEENLVFANAITSRILDSLRTEDFMTVGSNRIVTLLDVPHFWADRLVFNDLNLQMEGMDPSRFYNNLMPSVNEDRVKAIALREKRIVFSCRSVMDPLWNIKTSYQIATTWAFYPQKSSNFFLQTKHDNKSRSLVEGPSFMPYYTMVAEDFLVNGKCVGGYFPTARDQIRDAVSAAVRILKGESAEQVGWLEHTPSYNINWDVVRSLGMDVNKVPDTVNLHNVVLKDRKPKLYSTYQWLFWTAFSLILAASTIVISVLASKSRRNRKRLRALADETIRNNDILNQMMEIADFKTWEMPDDFSGSLHRFSASDFFLEKLRKFIRIDRPGNYALQIHCSIDGKPFHWYEIRMTVGEGDTGGLKRRGVIVNIDNQKQLEAIAAETNRIITSAKTREGFIASMNHEIRTPLNSIVGYTQLLAMPDIPMEPEELKEYTYAITSNSSILRNTINNILTATRISKSLITPHYESVELSSLIMNGREMSIDGHRIVPEPGPEGLMVRVDRTLFSRTLDNILFNAAMFSEEGADITLGWGRSDEEGLTAEIRVTDTGIGIALENQELVFERFFKVDSFTPGCGLGLYISRTFVELMGGQISFESKLGEGSVFKIKLA